MTIYHMPKLSAILGVPDFPIEIDESILDKTNCPIVPWNKGLTGVQESWNKGNKASIEIREKISQRTKMAMSKIDKKTKQKYYSERDSCNDRRWINKQGKHKRVKREELLSWLSEGWNEGRLIIQNPNNGKFMKVEK